jgi:L-asparaginase
MAGERAVPALDAHALLDAVPQLAAVEDLRAESVLSVPGAHMGLDDALAVARAAAAAAHEGAGVVVTHGTDTLEETAFLTDVLYDGDAPIVFTGAIRSASSPGADGPANLLDAVAVAGSAAATGLGVLVVFAGEVHAARYAEKVDSTAPRAFGSPAAGPLGHVAEGDLMLHARVDRRPAVAPQRLNFRVPIVPTMLGDDGAMLRAALDGGADGIVLVTLGAGHVGPGVLAVLRDAAAAVPVVVTARPPRGAVVRSTYGFEGAEDDVRSAGTVPAGLLTPQAARMKLLACLGAGIGDAVALRAAFSADDPPAHR